MAAEKPSVKLERVLSYLIPQQGRKEQILSCTCCTEEKAGQYFDDLEPTWEKLQALREVLCEWLPEKEIPAGIQADIDEVIAYRNSHSLLTSSTSITPDATLQHSEIKDSNGMRLSCWKGDITTLKDVTAIVNASNSGLLGCFVPEHRCIDNVIHSIAGPRLRDACYSIMKAQSHPEPVGLAKATPGFHLPASWVLHTVGPNLGHHKTPQLQHKRQLVSCYHSCLDLAETLPPLPDGRKVVVFCCISTGLFAFPSDLAASLAVEAVREWYSRNATTSITDVIFNTFLEKDYELYKDLLALPPYAHPIEGIVTQIPTLESTSPPLPSSIPTSGTIKARTWLEEADVLIISAGAGLSAATGLDYTSTALFEKHFPAFRAKGLRRLYDVFGYHGWSSPAEKWGYYFLHLDMVRKWNKSPIYEKLHSLAARFPGKHFIRTTNADGFFVKNGFDETVIATPQGQYRFLQCFDKCRPDAYVESEPYVDSALPFIDSESQVLMDELKIPSCQFCGGEMTLCVRGGRYFNPVPFRKQESKWRRFSHSLETDLGSEMGEEQGSRSLAPKQVVVLELGVGMNTPGVLRYPNEDLVSEPSSGRTRYRLIRVGTEASGCVPWELEEREVAVGISGDIRAALDLLV